VAAARGRGHPEAEGTAAGCLDPHRAGRQSSRQASAAVSELGWVQPAGSGPVPSPQKPPQPLAGGVPVAAPVVFTGGCAKNECLVSLISVAVKHPLRVPESPQTVAALGCALHGAERGR
jgi:hypothetical protein